MRTHEDRIPVGHLHSILTIANDNAAVYARTHPDFLIRMGHIPAEDQPPTDTSYISKVSPRDEHNRTYLAQAELLRSLHLSRRQRQIAARIAALVVMFEPQFTRANFITGLETTRGVVDPVLSVLTGIHSESTPARLKVTPQQALITEVLKTDAASIYGTTPALDWLAEEPDRSPELHEAIRYVQDINDSL